MLDNISYNDVNGSYADISRLGNETMRIEPPHLPDPTDIGAPMSPQELGRLLNLLLEAERAGARLLAAYLEELPPGTAEWVGLHAVQRDEARNCAGSSIAARVGWPGVSPRHCRASRHPPPETHCGRCTSRTWPTSPGASNCWSNRTSFGANHANANRSCSGRTSDRYRAHREDPVRRHARARDADAPL